MLIQLTIANTLKNRIGYHPFVFDHFTTITYIIIKSELHGRSFSHFAISSTPLTKN